MELVDADEVEEHPLQVQILVAVVLEQGRVGPPRVLVFRGRLFGPIEVDVAEQEQSRLVEVIPGQEAGHAPGGVGLGAARRSLEHLDGFLELELILLQAGPGEYAVLLLRMRLDQGGVLPLGEEVLPLRRVGFGVAVIPGDELAHVRRLGEIGLGFGIAVLGYPLVAGAIERIGREGHVHESPAQVPEGRRRGEDQRADSDDRQEGVDEGVGERALFGLERGARPLFAPFGNRNVPLEHAARQGGHVLRAGAVDQDPDQLGLLRLASLAVREDILDGDPQVEGIRKEGVRGVASLTRTRSGRWA